MPIVFISHATADRSFIEREILPLLTGHGIQPWYARDDIRVAEEWERSILQGLRSCDCFLLIMSPHSAQSQWVRREVAWVFNKGHQKPIVPVLMEDCDSDDFHLGLAGIQFIDFRLDPTAARQRLLAFLGIPSTPTFPNAQAPPTDPETGAFGMQFVLLSRGKFWMGSGGSQPGRQQEITHDFYIGVHPVTQGQWQDVMGNNPSWFSRRGRGQDKVKGISDDGLKQFPVECVSWEDVQKFLEKLNGREKSSGWLYRLPTEAEWEYSCRGGAISLEDCSYPYYFEQPTNNLTPHQANFGNALGRTSKVGSYQPNRLGIHDLHGNVWEWCDDLWNGGPHRAYRGGGWSNRARDCTAARRNGVGPSYRYYHLGFRLARVPSGK